MSAVAVAGRMSRRRVGQGGGTLFSLSSEPVVAQEGVEVWRRMERRRGGSSLVVGVGRERA